MLDHIRFQKFEFLLRFQQSATLPQYKGSTLRGAFGHAFRKTLCAMNRQQCDDCLLRETCAYSILFETPPSLVSGRMTKYKRAPHPYLFEVPLDGQRAYAAGDKFQFSMLLVGRALNYLPYIIQSIIFAGEKGLGREGGEYELERVSCGHQTVYDSTEQTIHSIDTDVRLPKKVCRETSSVTLNFLTPTRIPFQGRPLRHELPFRPFLSVLLRRISMLSSFHCEKDLVLDFAGLLKQAEAVEIKTQELRFWDWERRSNRQKQNIPMGGVKGTVSWKGDMRDFIPFLQLGEYLHVGKGAVMGMGQYEMEVE